MKISFAWWNTGLSPAGMDREIPEQKNIAYSIVTFLLKIKKVDFLALGEVKDSNVSDIKKLCDLEGYECYYDHQKIGRVYFDTIILFNFSKLSLEDSTKITDKKGGRTLKVAQRLDFYIIEDSKLTPIHIFVSHWPSRLWCEQNGADRHLLGIRLRDAVDEIHQDYNYIPNIILLGDYNDEPFDQSIAIQLRATRDRGLAAKKKDLLYNPFWTKLGTSQPYKSGDLVDHHAGSYYYRKDGISRWRTFDQIIFSSAFLGKTEWSLDEPLTSIIDISSIFSILPNNYLSASIRNMFDHSPVIGFIEKVDDHG